MLRRVVESIFGVALRIFFRRIELDGLSRIPTEGPVMFVLNHPNALVDPAFLLCLSPRPVSFLAKAPLFKTPVLGAIVRAFDSIPVYRRQDEGGARVDNQETFHHARELLLRGRAIAIFPEGTSHSDPKLKPLKTGAARIALGTGLDDLTIIPAGLFYTAKSRFRSDALVYFGAPLSVPHAPLDARGEPPPAAVAALTRDIDVALRAVTLHGDDHEILALVERTSEIFAAASEEAWTVAEAFELRQRLLAGHGRLRARDPARLDALVERVRRYERDLGELGLGPDHLAPHHITFTASLRYALRSLFALGVILPLALLGTALHYPSYRASGMVAARVAGEFDDMVATAKLLAAMTFFPLTWLLVGLGAGYAWGIEVGLAVGLLLAPASGYAALHFWERFATVASAARGLGLFLVRRTLLARLHAERQAIRAEILALAEIVA